MDPKQLHLDSVELRHAANQIRADHDPVYAAGKALPKATMELPPDDPLRTHRHLLAALNEFSQDVGTGM